MMTNLEKKVIGVDVGSKVLTLSFVDMNGKEMILNISNTQTDILRNLKKLEVKKYEIIMDATGVYSNKCIMDIY